MGAYKAIGDRLKRLRGKARQEEFAQKLGISYRTYQYYESGEHVPKGRVLQRISEVTEVSSSWLLTGEIDRVAETLEGYGPEEIIKKIFSIVANLDPQDQKKVLEYAEERRRLREIEKK